jgi:hypothetical protein
MLSKLLELVMVVTSLSPVLLTIWFKSFSEKWEISSGLGFLISAIFLWLVAIIILKVAKNKIQQMPVKIESISTADKEMISFIFVYLVPLLEINTPILLFLIVIFVFIVLTTHSYHFNPIFGLLGYHYYEVSIKDGTTFILMTKKTLMNVKQIQSVGQLTDYILIEKGK